MSLKKLSLAAALSIGILTVNGIANAAGCAVCPQPQAACPVVSPACPVQTTVCPTCNVNPCTCATTSNVPHVTSVTQVLPNCHPCSKTFERQAFAFPNLGSSSIVIPRSGKMVQTGGKMESVATNSGCCPSGLTSLPELGGALTVYPKNLTGAAAPGCPPSAANQIAQGTDVIRCKLPNATSIIQTNLMESMFTGAACPSAYPMASAMGSISPCNTCDPITGAAVPTGGCPIPIETSSGLLFQKTQLVPVTGAASPCAPAPCDPCASPCAPAPCPSGAACPIPDQYPDVSGNSQQGCDINAQTTQGVLAGYPDKYFRPDDCLKRSELAAAIVAGFDLRNVPGYSHQIFSDVPSCHWAKAAIDKAYNRGIVTGNTCNKFRPEDAATNAETLSALAKVLPSDMAPCDVQSVLSAYADAGEIPEWAKASVAKALSAGATKCLPDCTHIKPNCPTQRADIATMIKALREKLCLEAQKSTPCAVDPSPAPCVSGAAPCPTYQAASVSGAIPTLKIQMEDLVSARTSLIGDMFVAKTTEPITINGQVYPAGSRVAGRVVEVIRPGFGDNGGIRLSFDGIANGKCVATLPKDVLSATVIKEDNPNILGRIVAFPFTLPGKVIGVAGRTVGGAVNIAANASEGILNNIGNGNNELFNAKFGAAGRSYVSSIREAFTGVVDEAKNVVSGAVGVVKESADELAYLVSPDGDRISQVNPNEKVSIAFGACGVNASTGSAAPCQAPCDPCR